MKNKIIITCALVGSLTTKKNSPYIPITPEKIAKSGIEAAKAGASILHIHVRKDDGTTTCDLERFRKVVTEIRSECDVVINLTTSTTLDSTDFLRMKPFVELKPEIATYDCGTINQGGFVFENTEAFLCKNAEEMKKVNVKPEVECFDTAMVYSALRQLNEGVLSEPLLMCCVLGADGGANANIKSMYNMVKIMPKGTNWTGFGIGGKYSIPMIYASLAMGGHVRVGLEDNVYLEKGVLAKTNAELVKKAVKIIDNFGKEVATPGETRKILGLYWKE